MFSPSDCETGDMRYHNSIMIDAGMAPIGFNVPDNASCANCHGTGASFLDVQHTPEQTGGYSDMDLINIFTKGYKPNGSTFHTRIPPQIYQRFHTWAATDAEKTGLVCYLRSMMPMAQGPYDFGGLGGPRPGGMMGGGAGGAGGGMTAGGSGGGSSTAMDAGSK